jgi:deoxyribonuclease V
MQLRQLHPWDLSPEEAIRLQERLAQQVREEPLRHEVRLVAGLDVGIRDSRARAATVVVALPELRAVEQRAAESTVTFPYIPGLLSFREVPALAPVLAALTTVPDVLLVDGQGRAHPRRFGLACHVGLLLDHPTIGCAKSLLAGKIAEPLRDERGAWAPVLDRNELVGAAVRTRPGVAPVYVSVGHRVTLEDAIAVVLRCTTRYRLPEPARLAHLLTQTAAPPKAAPKATAGPPRLFQE